MDNRYNYHFFKKYDNSELDELIMKETNTFYDYNKLIKRGKDRDIYQNINDNKML